MLLMLLYYNYSDIIIIVLRFVFIVVGVVVAVAVAVVLVIVFDVVVFDLIVVIVMLLLLSCCCCSCSCSCSCSCWLLFVACCLLLVVVGNLVATRADELPSLLRSRGGPEGGFMLPHWVGLEGLEGTCKRSQVIVTTRIITFLVGNPNQNLHFHYYWEGGQPNTYIQTYCICFFDVDINIDRLDG